MSTAHRAITLAVILAAGCAARPPGPPSDGDGALEAMVRAFPRDANLYQLAAIDEAGAPGRKLARFERPAPGAGGTLARLLVAFCASAPDAWRCTGPVPAVRVPMDGSTYTALAPAEMDDATVVALFSYVGSECFGRQVGKLGLD